VNDVLRVSLKAESLLSSSLKAARKCGALKFGTSEATTLNEEQRTKHEERFPPFPLAFCPFFIYQSEAQTLNEDPRTKHEERFRPSAPAFRPFFTCQSEANALNEEPGTKHEERFLPFRPPPISYDP